MSLVTIKIYNVASSGTPQRLSGAVSTEKRAKENKLDYGGWSLTVELIFWSIEEFLRGWFKSYVTIFFQKVKIYLSFCLKRFHRFIKSKIIFWCHILDVQTPKGYIFWSMLIFRFLIPILWFEMNLNFFFLFNLLKEHNIWIKRDKTCESTPTHIFQYPKNISNKQISQEIFNIQQEFKFTSQVVKFFAKFQETFFSLNILGVFG